MDKQLEDKRRQLVSSLHGAGVCDERVLNALATTPRECFVDASQRTVAYDDRALGIEQGQTISQPFMVALMTQALQLQGSERVLEIGTGSGYQTAILAHLAGYVYSIERFPQMSTAFRTLSASFWNSFLHAALIGLVIAWSQEFQEVP